ncbi:hypothetical protein ILYODFUR_030091 [Ilyodon furcidens]|uniref:Uncharacterized protein n=1 Tax=Ilyodon furcidens TaxID=33524 RepID=A0ABV0TPN4_9TELE
MMYDGSCEDNCTTPPVQRAAVVKHQSPAVFTLDTLVPRFRFPVSSDLLCRCEYTQANSNADRDLLFEVVSVRFQMNSGAVCFWCEYNPSSIQTNYRKHASL